MNNIMWFFLGCLAYSLLFLSFLCSNGKNEKETPKTADAYLRNENLIFA